MSVQLCADVPEYGFSGFPPINDIRGPLRDQIKGGRHDESAKLVRRLCIRTRGNAVVRPGAGCRRTYQDRVGLGVHRSSRWTGAGTAGQVVFEADGLRTGPDGRLGITLKDDTRVSLGPSSEVRLDRFMYAPADGQLGFVLKVVRGVAAYVSGRIAKLSPDSIRLETPEAIVGVRGTTLALRVIPE